jgi:hypothetical protein
VLVKEKSSNKGTVAKKQVFAMKVINKAHVFEQGVEHHSLVRTFGTARPLSWTALQSVIERANLDRLFFV